MSPTSQHDIRDILQGAPLLKPISPEHTEIMVLELLAELRARHLSAQEWTRACELVEIINERHVDNQIEVTGRALAVSRLLLEGVTGKNKESPECRRITKALVQSLLRRTLFDWFLCNTHEPLLLPANDDGVSERLLTIQDVLEHPDVLPDQIDCKLTEEVLKKLGAIVVSGEQTTTNETAWKVVAKLETAVEGNLTLLAQLWLIADAIALREAMTADFPHQRLDTLIKLGELTNTLLADPEPDPPELSL